LVCGDEVPARRRRIYNIDEEKYPSIDMLAS
jgi:hypothetical protein